MQSSSKHTIVQWVIEYPAVLATLSAEFLKCYFHKTILKMNLLITTLLIMAILTGLNMGEITYVADLAYKWFYF